MIIPITTHLTHSLVWGRLYKNLQMRVLILLGAKVVHYVCKCLSSVWFVFFPGMPG